MRTGEGVGWKRVVGGWVGYDRGEIRGEMGGGSGGRLRDRAFFFFFFLRDGGKSMEIVPS